MDRLTIKDKYGEINPPYRLSSQGEEDEWNEDCRKKLAKYEDLEEQGLLLKLPCKIGDTVYEIAKGFSFEKGFHEYITETIFDRPDRIVYHMRYGDFGKTIFLTREEAETALEKINIDKE